MDTEECSKCGSEYKVVTHRTSFKESDNAKCEVCNNLLREWNSSTTYYEYILIKEGTNSK